MQDQHFGGVTRRFFTSKTAIGRSHELRGTESTRVIYGWLDDCEKKNWSFEAI